MTTLLNDTGVTEANRLLQRRDSNASHREYHCKQPIASESGPISNSGEKEERGHGGKFLYTRGCPPHKQRARPRPATLFSVPTRLPPSVSSRQGRPSSTCQPFPLRNIGAITFCHCLHDLVLSNHAVRLVHTEMYASELVEEIHVLAWPRRV